MEIKIKQEITFTVDVDAWAREYDLEATAQAVRDDFDATFAQFNAPEAFSAAWPGLVTAVRIRPKP
jgi:hypothetical protein